MVAPKKLEKKEKNSNDDAGFSSTSKIVTIIVILIIIIAIISAVVLLTGSDESEEVSNENNGPTNSPSLPGQKNEYEKLSINFFEYYDKTGTNPFLIDVIPDLRCYIEKEKVGVNDEKCKFLVVGDNQKGNLCSNFSNGFTGFDGTVSTNDLITLEKAKQICDDEIECKFFNYRINETSGFYDLEFFKEVNTEDFRQIVLSDIYNQDLSGAYAKRSNSNQLINLNELVD